MYAINPNGTLSWSYDVGSEVACPPTITPDGKVVFGTEDWSGLKVFALRGSAGPAQSVWPLARHNLANDASLEGEVLGPEIAVQPESQTVQAGAAVTFSVTASGAAPLTYQWRKNSAALANSSHVTGVTTDTLTLDGVTAADAGVYSVVVTNSSGTKVSSDAVLTVLAVDRAKPSVTITRPSPLPQFTNAVATIRGTAKDNVSVSTVYYQLNGGPWMAASGTTSWNASVTMTPGTNLLRACAVDSSGNWSVTNSLNLVYVLNAPLGVRIVGQGTVSPNYANQWLQIGKQVQHDRQAWEGVLPSRLEQ